MLGGLDKVWEGLRVGNCLLTAVSFRGIGKRDGREGRGELCVDSRLC